jgi:hypothetical protein
MKEKYQTSKTLVLFPFTHLILKLIKTSTNEHIDVSVKTLSKPSTALDLLAQEFFKEPDLLLLHFD